MHCSLQDYACDFFLYSVCEMQGMSSIGKIWIFKRFDLSLEEECYRRGEKGERGSKSGGTE